LDLWDSQKRPRAVDECRGALAPHPRRFAPAGGAIPISIRLDPEVHCAVVRRITVFRVAREQCKRHEPLAAVRVSEPR
jgi:hypothetical protein